MIKKFNKNIYLATILSLLMCVNASWAQNTQGTQNYPNKTIRIIVALAPGGGVDTAARMLGQRFTEAWGQQVVAENRPGAGGTIAAEQVARATPDGYTLLMTSMGHTITPAMYKLSFDVNKDFAAISLFVQSASVLSVHPSLPVKNVKDLVAISKRGNELTYATTGAGSSPHLTAEMLKLQSGIRILQIPYRGTPPAMTDLVAGNVSFMFGNILSVLPQVRNGRLRALAITSAKRSGITPNVPTVAETYPGFESGSWYGLFTPTGTPREAVARLHETTTRALHSPDVRDKFVAQGAELLASTQPEAQAYTRVEVAKWGKVVKASGAKAD